VRYCGRCEKPLVIPSLVIAHLSMASSIVVKRKDFVDRLAGPFAICPVLVDIISQMNDIVVLVLSSRISVSVEVSIG
jgi:hypothetical protein